MIPIYILFFDKRYKALKEARAAAGYTDQMPLMAARESPVLCMSTPGTDYPGVIPNDLICCGPILQASSPLEEVDPELYAWVNKRPTVLIVLGSHVRLYEEAAGHIYRSCQRLLDARKDVQVLWKLQKRDQYELPGLESYGDRIRTVDWLKPDPISILKTGNIVCFVNHGGSNSYHEALS